MNRTTLRLTTSFTIIFLIALSGCSSSTKTTTSNTRAATPAPTAPSTAAKPRMYSGFGNYNRTVTTTSKDAQKWFDQGMQLLYGFNHDEAIRSFTEAARLDPDCAMAWWGVSYGHGLHINNPVMTDEQSRGGYEAATKALKALNNETAVEKALVRAVAKRYEWPAPKDRKSLDEAYAAAMQQAWREHPNDPDVGALFAESLMDMQPWDLWTHAGQPKGRTPEIVAALEKVMAIEPDHPGANHFYIHAVEASEHPEKAVPAAERLAELVPGSGHLVHMPSHIWIRTGRYSDSADTNEKAIKIDKSYFALAPPPRFYSLYFVHNVHFLAYSAMFEGRYKKAMEAAEQMDREAPESFLREFTPVADGLTPVKTHVLVRFGKWKEILKQPEPESYRKISCAMWLYGRCVALAALDRTSEAREELAAYDELIKTIGEEWFVGQNPAKDVLPIARKMMEAEVLYREGQHAESFVLLRDAVVMEENLKYDEPPGWMQPVRHALGALLLADATANAIGSGHGWEAERIAEAEAVYRADLVRHPNNGWSLLGLRTALEAQNRNREAREINEQLNKAWKRADVKPSSSCYCAPLAMR